MTQSNFHPLIDVDDVTAQFRQRFVDLANELFNRSWVLEDCTKIFECEKAMKLTKAENSKIWVQINKPGFASSLDLMEGAGDAIERIASRHDVYFVTSPLKSSPTWVSDRTRWIRKHFGTTLAKKIIFTKMKYMIDGDCLIDDNIDILSDWMTKRMARSPGRPHWPMIYHWPYNVNGSSMMPRFTSWPNIVAALQC
jgi:5'(3')-deoxyribonucleotidase